MSKRKLTALLLSLLMIVTGICAFADVRTSRNSVCHLCGRTHNQKWLFGISVGDTIEECPASKLADVVAGHLCAHSWVLLNHSTSTISGRLGSCAVGSGGMTLGAFHHLSFGIDSGSLSDKDARAFLRQIQQSDELKMDVVEKQLFEKLSEGRNVQR